MTEQNKYLIWSKTETKTEKKCLEEFMPSSDNFKDEKIGGFAFEATNMLFRRFEAD